MTLEIIILAAGQGKRMHSSMPKVLHQLAGVPLLKHVVKTAQSVNPDNIYVIYGNEGSHVQAALPDLPVTWVEQKEALGTGHAVQQVLPYLPDDSNVLILSGDVPLISVKTLKSLLSNSNHLNLLVANLDNPFGLGRIIRDKKQNILGIIEEKDANNIQKQIQEIYTGILSISSQHLKQHLPKLTNHNQQSEYYLTELIQIAVENKLTISSETVQDLIEIQGVNTKNQLISLERQYQSQLANKLLSQGVMIMDPNRFDVRGELVCGSDVTIDINNLFLEKVTIGSNSYIGPNCVLKNVELGANVTINANTVIEGAIIKNNCTIGPFARIRPGTELGSNVKIGNFVEIKKSKLAQNTKAGHLTYLGDAVIGENVNIGAGTITCNYDGVNKHQTKINDGAFIGSNSALVAPIEIGKNAVIGAGSAIRKNVPDNALGLSVSEEKIIKNWGKTDGRKEEI